MASRQGVVLVISAPSGTGKSTLVRRLLIEFPDFAYSVSCTTRAPRPGEVDGRDYHFLDREAFIARRDAGYFAEWAEVHGNFYGTPRQETLDLLAQGRDVLFDIDVQGASQLRTSMSQGAYVFLFPPSRQALVDRLDRRGGEAPEVVELRLRNAAQEIERAGLFDYWVVNDDLEEAYRDLRAVYLAEGRRPRYQKSLMADILATWGTPDAWRKPEGGA